MVFNQVVMNNNIVSQELGHHQLRMTQCVKADLSEIPNYKCYYGILQHFAWKNQRMPYLLKSSI